MSTIRELVSQLGSDDGVKAYRAHRQLADTVDRVTDPSASTDREALATALTAELLAVADGPGFKVEPTNVPGVDDTSPRRKHSAAVRRHLCRFLTQVASNAQVPALAEALHDLEVRDGARMVLECIATSAATSALVKALADVGPVFRIGVINALSKQRWSDALAALSRQANDPDSEVRLAAVEGIANFPEATGDKLILAATQIGSARERARAQRARVRLAETLRWAGEKRSAIAIYRSILTDAADGPWKGAARGALEQLKVKTD